MLQLLHNRSMILEILILILEKKFEIYIDI